jgi:hypothetical protein
MPQHGREGGVEVEPAKHSVNGGVGRAHGRLVGLGALLVHELRELRQALPCRHDGCAAAWAFLGLGQVHRAQHADQVPDGFPELLGWELWAGTF